MIVIDASALIDLVIGENPAGDIVADVILHHGVPFIPAHTHAEVLHGVRGMTLGKKISAPVGKQALSDFAQLTLTVIPTDTALLHRAWDLRTNLSGYDALYVALAEKLNCELLTGDERIAKAHVAQCPVLVVNDEGAIRY